MTESDANKLLLEPRPTTVFYSQAGEDYTRSDTTPKRNWFGIF